MLEKLESGGILSPSPQTVMGERAPHAVRRNWGGHAGNRVQRSKISFWLWVKPSDSIRTM